MVAQNEPVRVSLVPFGTVHISAVFGVIEKAAPEPEDRTPTKLIEGTTAQTRIVSCPRPLLFR